MSSRLSKLKSRLRSGSASRDRSSSSSAHSASTTVGPERSPSPATGAGGAGGAGGVGLGGAGLGGAPAGGVGGVGGVGVAAQAEAAPASAAASSAALPPGEPVDSANTSQQSSSSSSAAVSKSGVLHRLLENGKDWRKRPFVLSSSQFQYFSLKSLSNEATGHSGAKKAKKAKAKKEGKAKSVLVRADMSVEVVPGGMAHKEFVFRVSSGGGGPPAEGGVGKQEIVCATSSREALDAWVGALLRAVQYHTQRRATLVRNTSASFLATSGKSEGDTAAALEAARAEWTAAALTRKGSFTVVTNVEVRQQIGKGSFGEVYMGKWRAANVALKCLRDLADPAKLAEFEKEALVSKDLSHPFIVSFYGIYTNENGDPFLVQEYMSGGALNDLLLRNRRTDVFKRGDLVRFMLDCCKGMSYLEEERVCHRDLAARNLLVEGAHCKVADFGLSRAGSEYQISESAPLPVKWSAPEVLLQGKASHMSDMYAFGVTMWEIAEMGKTPFPFMSTKQVYDAVTGDDARPERPRDVSDAIWDVMQRSWATLPEDRPTFASLLDPLRAAKKMETQFAFSGDSAESSTRASYSPGGPSHFHSPAHTVDYDRLEGATADGDQVDTAAEATVEYGRGSELMLDMQGYGSTSAVLSQGDTPMADFSPVASHYCDVGKAMITRPAGEAANNLHGTEELASNSDDGPSPTPAGSVAGAQAVADLEGTRLDSKGYNLTDEFRENHSMQQRKAEATAVAGDSADEFTAPATGSSMAPFSSLGKNNRMSHMVPKRPSLFSHAARQLPNPGLAAPAPAAPAPASTFASGLLFKPGTCFVCRVAFVPGDDVADIGENRKHTACTMTCSLCDLPIVRAANGIMMVSVQEDEVAHSDCRQHEDDKLREAELAIAGQRENELASARQREDEESEAIRQRELADVEAARQRELTVPEVASPETSSVESLVDSIQAVVGDVLSANTASSAFAGASARDFKAPAGTFLALKKDNQVPDLLVPLSALGNTAPASEGHTRPESEGYLLTDELSDAIPGAADPQDARPESEGYLLTDEFNETASSNLEGMPMQSGLVPQPGSRPVAEASGNYGSWSREVSRDKALWFREEMSRDESVDHLKNIASRLWIIRGGHPTYAASLGVFLIRASSLAGAFALSCASFDLMAPLQGDGFPIVLIQHFVIQSRQDTGTSSWCITDSLIDGDGSYATLDDLVMNSPDLHGYYAVGLFSDDQFDARRESAMNAIQQQYQHLPTSLPVAQYPYQELPSTAEAAAAVHEENYHHLPTQEAVGALQASAQAERPPLDSFFFED